MLSLCLRSTLLVSLCLLLTISAAPLRAQIARHEFEHQAMGVRFRYILYHADGEKARELFDLASRRVAELEAVLSDYREQSETNQLCRTSPHAAPQSVSPDLFRVAEQGLEYYRLTGGAFDVTVGPASHAWRKAIKRNRLPEADAIERLRPSIGSDKLRLLPPSQLQLLAAGMQLDFGGIAQGDAADQIGALFRAAGVNSALIDVSGDVLALGAPPERAGWAIQIASAGREEAKTVLLRDAAISTSGDNAQRLVIDGVRYSHLVDPRTARAVEQSVQATVIAPTATAADALASALCVMTPEEGLSLVDRLPQTHARLRMPPPGPAGKQQEETTRESPNFHRLIVPSGQQEQR